MTEYSNGHRHNAEDPSHNIRTLLFRYFRYSVSSELQNCLHAIINDLYLM